jgi:hypothetical protein
MFIHRSSNCGDGDPHLSMYITYQFVVSDLSDLHCKEREREREKFFVILVGGRFVCDFRVSIIAVYCYHHMRSLCTYVTCVSVHVCYNRTPWKMNRWSFCCWTIRTSVASVTDIKTCVTVDTASKSKLQINVWLSHVGNGDSGYSHVGDWQRYKNRLCWHFVSVTRSWLIKVIGMFHRVRRLMRTQEEMSFCGFNRFLIEF